MMRVGKRLALLSVALLSIVAGCPVVSSPVYGTRPAIPRIEDIGGWQLSEGCRVYEFGMLTDPDCDLLTGDGVAIQVTRVRIEFATGPGQSCHHRDPISAGPRCLVFFFAVCGSLNSGAKLHCRHRSGSRFREGRSADLSREARVGSTTIRIAAWRKEIL
jgi:hypothetical protein